MGVEDLGTNGSHFINSPASDWEKLPLTPHSLLPTPPSQITSIFCATIFFILRHWKHQAQKIHLSHRNRQIQANRLIEISSVNLVISA